MSDSRRLEAIRVAMTLARAAISDDAEPVDVDHDLYSDVIIELARFAAAQTQIAAVNLRSTPEAEFDDYLERATALLGEDAPVIPILHENPA